MSHVKQPAGDGSTENDAIGSRWLRVSTFQGTWIPPKSGPFHDVSAHTVRRALRRARMVYPLRLAASPSENATTGNQRCTSVAICTRNPRARTIVLD
jgi:hypothetical protein